MKKVRIFSGILAILLILSTFGLPVFASDVDVAAYPTTEYTSEQAKVNTMTKVYEDKDAGAALYFDITSGELAWQNLKTGEYLFTNPYDIAINNSGSSASKTTDDASKRQADPLIQSLLSQVILEYQDKLTGSTAVMKSFTDAALAGDQISYSLIPGGIRVEYAIGTVEPKRLIPQWIDRDRFQTLILDVLASHLSEMTSAEQNTYTSISSETSTVYKLVGPADMTAEYDPQSTPDAARPETFKYLVDNKEAGTQMYYLTDCGERKKKSIEQMIKKYCPNYTYDVLEEDHEITGYEGDEIEPPLFRLAIEYTVDENGLTASIPAKSIRYNETNYVLESIAFLPYFGCAAADKTTGSAASTVGEITRKGGYIFIPDGSGTLLSYYEDDGELKAASQGNSMYGYDYTLETLSSTNVNAKTFNLPVFGLTEVFDVTKSTSRGTAKPVVGNKVVTEEHSRGYFAVIEAGDSFASIRANLRSMAWGSAAGTVEYSTVYALFSAKSTDTVSIGGSIGGGDNSRMSKTIDTKYTGNYTIHYTMLSDPATAESKNVDYYEPTYIGMAECYRDYLLRKNAIEKMTAAETETSLPLYIHSFGALEAEDIFLSLPVEVTKPLTTFDDVITMSKELQAEGIVNLKFILEGFANGGMSKPYYPTYVKWMKEVGGKKGLNRLLDFAEETGVEIFPDFDFANVAFSKFGKGFKFREYVAEMMSGRYASKREYNPVTQTIRRMGNSNVVSSGSYLSLYEKFSKQYDKYGINAISVLSLGTDLNSDFNEDSPITREDSKTNTENLMQVLMENYGKVLVRSGNAYTLPYATDVVGMSLDNSRYQISSYSVPFVGMVLHGYMNYAGDIINTAGDAKYEVLKSLENGAALYFQLSYQNTSELKKAIDQNLNENYSVSYETWKEDLVYYYNLLNDAVKNLQTATITGHDFLTAFRMDAKDAELMFAQFNRTVSSFEETKAKYYATIESVDSLRADQKETEATELLKTEIELREQFNTLTETKKLAKTFTSKFSIANVVSVTYTDNAGNDTVFFINYNNYPVAVEYEGGIYMMEPESFVNAAEIKKPEEDTISYQTVQAIVPTAGQLTNFNAAVDALAAAETEKDVSRAQAKIDKVLKGIVKTTPYVTVLTNEDGTTGYFNYTTDYVIVTVSDYEYIVIGPQSYVIR